MIKKLKHKNEKKISIFLYIIFLGSIKRKSTFKPFLKYLTSLPDSMAKYISKSGREAGGGTITILRIKVELK